MVHTRGQGARLEGFTEYTPPKRERKRAPRRAAPAPVPAPVAPAAPAAYKEAATQTEIILTNFPEPSTGKRRRGTDEIVLENASKRLRNETTPEPKKFLFNSTRNRSLLTSAPAKYTSQRESPFYDRLIKPTSKEAPVQTSVQPLQQQARAEIPQTPSRPPPQGSIFGSVRKFLSFLTGTPAAGNHEQQESGSTNPESNTESATDQEVGSPGTPTPAVQSDEPESPVRDPEILDSKIYTREYFKRRRTANTIGGREQLESTRDNAEEGSVEFNPIQTPGSSKRKLASVEGKVPGPQRGGFGIDDSYLDTENEVDGIEESQLAGEQPSTPGTKIQLPQTPLRSALRQNGSNFGIIGRSAKSVRINPTTSVKHVYGQYGYAGEYHGSMFADTTTNSDSSISTQDLEHMHSPTTMQNTKNNQTPKFRLDHSIIDPNDQSWRPSLANPTPGHFRVPDMDEYDDDDTSTVESEPEPHQEQVPPQPSTPRMSHAELPQPSPPNTISSFTGHTESILNDATEIRLNKARSDAQKYKPARSSRLSLTEKARSRSSSPPSSEADFSTSLEVGTPGPTISQTTQRLHTEIKPTEEIPEIPAKPLGREELDNTIIGEDGMTDYQREHQYDEWAENLPWPQPQTYEEAGISSNYIADLVRKNWTERDTRESLEFWDKEFDEGLKAAREAAAQGKQLVWITDPLEMNEL